MFLLLFISFLIFFVLVLLLLVAHFVCERSNNFTAREELSPYECGFEISRDSRLPFSIRYFLLTLVFLVFDLEIIFLLFIPLTIFIRFNLFSFLSLLGFIFILFVGLIYE
jgi:NADH-ubiquinone oxidoreductase chain 3